MPKAVADLAADLLKIQASREAQPGHAYGGDTPWQREFEGRFRTETRDQWSAIQSASKTWNGRARWTGLFAEPLVFRKTEVAIRRRSRR